MMAFPSMLSGAAKNAGMKTPPDPDHYQSKDYPHFFCFCVLQLGRAMQPGEHWENAKVIAAIPEHKIKTMLPTDFAKAGVTGLCL